MTDNQAPYSWFSDTALASLGVQYRGYAENITAELARRKRVAEEKTEAARLKPGDIVTLPHGTGRYVVADVALTALLDAKHGMCGHDCVRVVSLSSGATSLHRRADTTKVAA